MTTFRMSSCNSNSNSSSNCSSRRSTMMITIFVGHSIIIAIILLIGGVDSFTANNYHQPSTITTTRKRSYNQRYDNKLLPSCRRRLRLSHHQKKNHFLLTRHYSSSMDKKNGSIIRNSSNNVVVDDDDNEKNNYGTEKNLEQQQQQSVSVSEVVGERYICLFDNYHKVKGSYFNALFDQMLDQTRFEYKNMIFCTTNADIQNIIINNDNDSDNVADDDDDDDDDGIHKDDDETTSTSTTTTTTTTTTKIASMLDELKISLDLKEIPELFIMDDWNPLKIQERFSVSSDSRPPPPSIIWLYGNYNALHTRHLLRTSGFDKYIQKQCASSFSSTTSSSSSSSSSSSNPNTSMFIGEGTGALCASYTMDIAVSISKEGGSNKNNDRIQNAVVPELQKFGLQLIYDGSSDNDNDNNNNFDIDIQNLKDDQVFVWSQQQQQQDESDYSTATATATATATKFIITPSKRGTIEKYETPNPLPPLFIATNDDNKEGVQCNGEPSIDPSRSIQTQDIGESEEWW